MTSTRTKKRIILVITKKKMKRERPIDPLTRHSSISGGEYEFNRRPIISVVEHVWRKNFRRSSALDESSLAH